MQYNFARLCAFLSTEVDDFRQKALLPVMHDYHEKQRCSMTLEQQQNLLLFFAEVYEKLETVSFFLVLFFTSTLFIVIFSLRFIIWL